jgi:Tetratricopeptide repeat
VARRGAAQVPPTGASDAWRAAGRAHRREQGAGKGVDAAGGPGAPLPWQPDEWIDEGELRDEAAGAVERSREGRRAPGGKPAIGKRGPSAGGGTGGKAATGKAGPGAGGGATGGGATGKAATGKPGDRAGGGATGKSATGRAGAAGADSGSGRPSDRPRRTASTGAADADTDADVQGTSAGDLHKAVAPDRLARFEARLHEADAAFRRDRFEEARRILRPLANQAPRASSVRELYGLTLYRLGRWAQAARELEAFRTQTGSAEQDPVLADCYRALGRYADVEELWDELRAASPGAELVAEGRIVAAGALADQGRLDEAIHLLEGGTRPTRRPRLHHLRVAYALADLYERAGDLPRARELFGRIAASDPDFIDVEARIRALR